MLYYLKSSAGYLCQNKKMGGGWRAKSKRMTAAFMLQTRLAEVTNALNQH
jgi:hypothetical protein